MTRPIPLEDLDQSKPFEPEPAKFPRWLSDMRPLHAAILMVAIWAVTFIAIWRLNP